MIAPRILVAAAILVMAGSAVAVELPQNKPASDNTALEQKLQQRDLPPHDISGFVHIPDQKAGVLIQPPGREFRDFRTKIQPWLDAALIIVAVAAMAALYLIAGPMRYTADPAGRTVKRFAAFERFVHWLTASSFIWLALTGLNLVFGRRVLQPLIGDDPFAALSHWAKLSHNSVGFAFMAGLFVMTVQWLVPNIPNRLDWQWIKAGGGMFGGPHPPAKKFNAGQKMIYWIAVLGGGAISLTGIALLLPFYAFDIGGMQLMQVFHSVIAALMIATIIGHIYLGTIGVAGSFSAMSTGRVDRNWAHEHHPLWLADLESKRPGTPAE